MGTKQFIGTGLIALALFLFWIFPYAEYSKISALKTAIADRDAILKQRTDIQAQISKLTTQYTQEANAIQVLTSVVPTKKQTAEVISFLQTIAFQNGVQLGGINFSESTAETDKPYNTIRLQISGTGTYSSLRGMLDGLERNVRLTDVREIKLNTDPQLVGRIGFDFQADVYFLK